VAASGRGATSAVTFWYEETRMTVVETYAPGKFCWVDLGTTDAPAAKRFYTGLFGWTAEDRPTGGDMTYTMFALGGKSVAALYQQDAQQQAMGIPPNWLSYISVESADAAAERTKGLGGTVLMEPFDVLDVGRMAMIQDPTGAVVALWEPRRHIGAELIEEPNTLAWNELATTDTARAGTFYAGLLGWASERQQYGAIDYTIFKLGEQMSGGMMAIAPDWGPVPPHWLVYFAVEDCDAAADRAEELGGAVHMPPTDIPRVGRFAMFRDPQGAVFAVIKFLPG
jgi:predicted enzyme related to lactoylglutathione lyase